MPALRYLLGGICGYANDLRAACAGIPTERQVAGAVEPALPFRGVQASRATIRTPVLRLFVSDTPPDQTHVVSRIVKVPVSKQVFVYFNQTAWSLNQRLRWYHCQQR